MSEDKEHLVPLNVYVRVLLMLMAFLVLTIAAAFINIDNWTKTHHLGSGWNTGIAVSIAMVKGLLIVLFFMHLRYGNRLNWVFAAAGFVWLGIMLTLTLTDYLTRNHPAGSSPRGEPRYVQLHTPHLDK